MKQPIPMDLDHVPAGKIRVSDFLEMVDLLVEDITLSIMTAVDDADSTPEQKEAVETALDRGAARANAIVDSTLRPKPDA